MCRRQHLTRCFIPTSPHRCLLSSLVPSVPGNWLCQLQLYFSHEISLCDFLLWAISLSPPLPNQYCFPCQLLFINLISIDMLDVCITWIKISCLPHGPSSGWSHFQSKIYYPQMLKSNLNDHFSLLRKCWWQIIIIMQGKRFKNCLSLHPLVLSFSAVCSYPVVAPLHIDSQFLLKQT